jgi:TRAP-type C4-dicarboxylate transport system permease large subunit
VRALVPFFIAQLGVVIVIILVPGLSSWLPGLFH